MRGSPLQLESLTRPSLSAQAAAVIDRAIREGRWVGSLPGERQLCVQLGISRPTLRVALRLLERDQAIAIHHGRRPRILTRQARRGSPRDRVIGLITMQPTSLATQYALDGVGDLRVRVAESGYSMESLVIPPASTQAQLRSVERFVRESRISCSVLVSVSREVQRWFAQRSIPALVLGSTHRDIQLPSLDIDHRAICRHAAGVFLAKHHRSLALVVGNYGLAGDLASEEGFLEGVRQHSARNGAVHAQVLKYAHCGRDLRARLRALFRSSPPPTALLVTYIWPALAVQLHLLRQGLSVPGDVSLIARDQDSSFEEFDPPISHYRLGKNALAGHLSRLVLKLVCEGRLAPEPTLIVPEYFEGATVRTPP